jgi:hypothetical protein
MVADVVHASSLAGTREKTMQKRTLALVLPLLTATFSYAQSANGSSRAGTQSDDKIFLDL